MTDPEKPPVPDVGAPTEDVADRRERLRAEWVAAAAAAFTADRELRGLLEAETFGGTPDPAAVAEASVKVQIREQEAEAARARYFTA